MSTQEEAFDRSALFQGIAAPDRAAMLRCLGGTRQRYDKRAPVYRAGERVLAVGLVLEGCLHTVREDFWGNRNLLAVAGPGALFGETCACGGGGITSASVMAAEESEVLFLDVRRALTVCGSACAFHARLIRNLLAVVAERNQELLRKLEHVTQRSTREKLLSYLSAQSQRAGAATFAIPLNRQQLADYLSVERSAMSGELSRLRGEGVLDFCRNEFTLHQAGRD